MLGDEENIGFDLNSKEEGFRYYKIMIKIMSEEKVQHQNIEVYTSGLKNLLEMRRIHTLTFSSRYLEKMQTIMQNN